MEMKQNQAFFSWDIFRTDTISAFIKKIEVLQ